MVGLRRTISSRPGEVDLGEGFAHDLVGERVVAADERLDRRQRRRGVLRLVCAVEREEQLVVLPPQAAEADRLAAHRRHPGHDAELDALAYDGGADLRRAAQQHRGDLDRLLREHRDGRRA